MNGARPAQGRSIVWLASYPKSGNTWLRALLTAWFAGNDAGDSGIDINRLVGGAHQLDRQLLEDSAGISSGELTAAELVPYRARLHQEIAGQAQFPCFLKTHCAMHCPTGADRMFAPEFSAGAVLIVRDPRDIVPSFAHQFALEHDAAIAMMADPEAALGGWSHRTSVNLPQTMGDWSAHVSGWLDQRAIPLLLLRYEDLLGDPAEGLRRVLGFVGIEPDAARIARAVEQASFDRLRLAERLDGFAEARLHKQGFFRSGTSGEGRRTLSSAQIGALESMHGAVMGRLGYLCEGDKPL